MGIWFVTHSARSQEVKQNEGQIDVTNITLIRYNHFPEHRIPKWEVDPTLKQQIFYLLNFHSNSKHSGTALRAIISRSIHSNDPFI